MPLKDKIKNKIKTVTKWDYEGTLRKVKDTSNFEIDKQGRFAARFFQCVLSVISYYFLGSQVQTFLKTFNLGQTINSLM